MNEVDFSKVGLKMKQLRSERGITQEQVAKDLNCTVPFVSNVENNRTAMSLRMLTYYARLVGFFITLSSATYPWILFWMPEEIFLLWMRKSIS